MATTVSITKRVLTIVVPTYNMEAYLEQCLQSLLLADRPERVQVLIINDGSTDSSSHIAQRYQESHPEVFTLINKPNGNYGSCINAALPLAKGQYIKVVDADDSVMADGFSTLVSTLEAIDADVVFTPRTVRRVEGGENVEPLDLSPHRVLPMQQACQSNTVMLVEMHTVTYRTEMLQKMNYRQTEGISYTDQEWIFAPMTQARTVYCLPAPVYRYLLGRPGQTVAPEVERRSMSHCIKLFSDMLYSLETLSVPAYMQAFVDHRLVLRALDLYQFFLLHHPMDNRDGLRMIDAQFQATRPTAYAVCARATYRLHVPYHYVAAWRKGREQVPAIIRLWAKALDWGHQLIKKH